ncbi:HAD family hydrolase [Cellulosilyticum ruminicola]|uniref:HAD family hydrolase n=1 Tax=Cellulosilyticum ruminicola TaxID=425254 RepID=UPI0006D298FF|nr:HAD-IA family hydrolase [Cellulosilyticum ruminicola]
MKYKAVLFDFDYTLANSEKGILMCFRHVLNTHGYENISDEAIKKTIGMTLQNAFKELTGIEDMTIIEAYRNEYISRADIVMTPNTKLYPETLPALEKLREAGIQIGIISTKLRYRIEAIFEVYELPDWISIIVGSEDVKTNKPSPEGLLYAMNVLGVSKEEVLYVGDNIIDAKTAQSAGVDFVAVTTGTNKAEDFTEYPCKKVICNLSYLADVALK